MKQVILLLTNHSDFSIQQKISQLIHTTNNNTDFFILYNLPNGSNHIPQEFGMYKKFVFPFSSDILYKMKYMPFGDSLVVGNCHFPILKFYLSHSDYDYYWIIEDDVKFNGNWNLLFNSFTFDTSDLLSTFVRSYHEDENWGWWESLRTGKDKVPVKEFMKSFNPIYRLSNKAAKCIHCALLTGWEGHCEVVIASILYHYNFSIKDMNTENSIFYKSETLSHLPLKIQNMEPNLIYHPIKCKIGNNNLRKNCIISAVGKNSLHSKWINQTTDRSFDLHLIVYDTSFSKFYNDADFLTYKKGYKLKLVYNYLLCNPQYLKHYDYFFIPDDDILTDCQHIEKLFVLMEEYHLKIAQPSLKNSYYTYPHTLQEHFSKLRYTDCIEMMCPCFSKGALKKVLKTFDANESGWGVEFQWSQLIGSNHRDMAIFDELTMIHTRPVQINRKQNFIEYNNYIQRHHLDTNIHEYGYIPNDDINKYQENYTLKHKQRKTIIDNLFLVANIIQNRININIISRTGLDGIMNAALFLNETSNITEAVTLKDYSVHLIEDKHFTEKPSLRFLSFMAGSLGIIWASERIKNEEKKDQFSLTVQQLSCNNIATAEFGIFGYSWTELISAPTYIVMTKLSATLLKKEKSNNHKLFCYAWKLIGMVHSLYKNN